MFVLAQGVGYLGSVVALLTDLWSTLMSCGVEMTELRCAVVLALTTVVKVCLLLIGRIVLCRS